MPADPAGRCAVLGSPIAHSLSPVLHRAAYRALDLDWEYDAYEVTEAELSGFMAGLDARWRGLSLTMPLKREVIGLCDRVESLGRLLQSINTVVIGDDGRRSGYNTDVPGMVAAFKAAGVHRLAAATIVGGGATAASTLAAVAQLGADQVTLVVRTPDRARHLLDLAVPLNLDVQVLSFERLAELPAVDAVVATIPAEAQGQLADAVVASAETVFDVVYHPRRTPLVVSAQARGRRVIPGFELLLHQAGRQVELMTGTKVAPLDEMRLAGQEELDIR